VDVDSSNPLPLYAQVENILASDIANGTFPVGSPLPPEDALVRRFGVSRTTVRSTILSLIRRGLVEIRRGKGTFVTQPRITQELTSLTGFVEDMNALGRRPTARVIGKRRLIASQSVATHLGLSAGDSVVRIQRLRLADDVPISFDETYLPTDLGEKVITNDLKLEPIFSLLEQKYNIALIEAEYRLEATLARGEVAKALGIKAGSPIFLIERTSYSDRHRPVDYERLFYRGDQIRFVTRLTRHPSQRIRTDRHGRQQISSPTR
jgi:GntR family transcriptional regulator